MKASSRPTVLLIDDEPGMLKLMEYAFADENFDLVACRSPAEGLEALARGDIDCVVIDIHFARTPECLGFLSAMRSLPGTAHVPVFATSAMTDYEVAQQALGLGARKFIPKPFYPGEIVEELRSVFT